MPSFVLPATRIVLTAANAAPRRFEERHGCVEYQLRAARRISRQGCALVRRALTHVIRAVSVAERAGLCALVRVARVPNGGAGARRGRAASLWQVGCAAGALVIVVVRVVLCNVAHAAVACANRLRVPCACWCTCAAAAAAAGMRCARYV